MWARDDVSGADLDPALVDKARKLEMDYFRSMRVCDKVSRSLAKGKTAVKTMWIDVNKGDAIDHNYRSRSVGKEFRVEEDPGLYAATPPLEALRVILSRAANNSEMKIMTNDVSRGTSLPRPPGNFTLSCQKKTSFPGRKISLER